MHNLFFDPKRYDLMRVGRYKFNKKLSVAARITGQISAEDIIHPDTGEILAKKGEPIAEGAAIDIQNAGINTVGVLCGDHVHLVVGNNFADASAYLDFDPRECGIQEMVHLPTLMQILDSAQEKTYAAASRKTRSHWSPNIS